MTQERQVWFLSRTQTGPQALVPVSSANVRTLEDLGRMTWMAIGACVLLFVASLPGGLTTVLSMLIGVSIGVTGIVGYRRAKQGPPVEPPMLDAAHDQLRRQAQNRVLLREFGRSGALPAPGRRVEVVDVHALRAVSLCTPEGKLRAVLLDAAEDGWVLVNGALVRVEFGEGRNFSRRTRIEALPRTHGVLSLTTYGSRCPQSELVCDDKVLAWLGGCRDLERFEIDELPWGLANQLGARLAPYRE